MQTKDNQIESQKREIGSLGNQVQDLEKSSKELAEERAALSQLKEQHSSELAKQKTTLDDATNHYQNTLTEEQRKLQLKEEELRAANAEIGRIKLYSEQQTVAVNAQKALVTELNQVPKYFPLLTQES